MPNDWPIETAGMPDVTGTRLAHRLVPRYVAAIECTPLWLALAGMSAVLIGIAAMCGGHLTLGGATAVVGLVATASAVNTDKRLKLPRPLAEEFANVEEIYQALATSPDLLEQTHLFLGTAYGVPYDAPVLLVTELLAHHLAVFGPTASGKSMRGVMQLLFQILDRGNSSIVMLDAKGAPVTKGEA